jgi:hypothetical protein
MRKKPKEQSAQPDGTPGHRARSVCLLDKGGPYGCRDERSGKPRFGVGEQGWCLALNRS